MRLRVYLTFNSDTVCEPIIWKLAKEFDVMTNIRTAEVKESTGLVGLELEGKTDVVDAAVKWLVAQGVHVEPIEQNVIEG
ncbi:MAG: FeS-binding protein [Zetaproteobacteria bacterium CG12_big_fil_rev_8_21_14_0_65_54_13]|nr:MAG: FeS-binding protein [Zetaproteobacteria bacterium CG23_combo_of_CG06-09_8_20_14_all_54_7]PIW44385.1 MAG: FeS-binding protein [Zetaproteobacteria bacterium CG12_big_fil_rev_8_21_14_0_65_54_13]PIX55112.1 MAG: FeS-binding protein [Zetaproteobacteria bacterium CG_4_10_14_3_um_filter_54_28]PJA30170.1 MAG: FeS-binding protein [Zetaproteobacteria bacterium CG_4_9_14_3_um_filter_54_145]